MQSILRQIGLELLFISPAFVVVCFIWLKRNASRKKHSLPFQELRRRPPGEFLRLKLDILNESIDEWTTLLVGLPAVLGGIVGVVRDQNPPSLLILLALCVGWTVYCAWRLTRLSRDRANIRIGVEGERYVGEELNRLVARGFEVYHDLPFDGFNVDHVVAGLAGVFVIETKARRKPVNESGEKEYRVVFDGSGLRWPNGSVDFDAIGQTENNARTVSEWLSGAVGEAVSTTAILTLPGWMVDRKGRPKQVHVLNPKEILNFCTSSGVPLGENLLKRVIYQLDQKCKMDIEAVRTTEAR